MEVYIIRHTPVAVGKETCYGQLDVELADSFADDYLGYQNSLPLDSFDQVYCSPLSRCRKLAAALNIDSYKLEDRLLEINFGEWEGKKWTEIPKEELNPWMENFVNLPPPQGESFQEIYDRCSDFLQELSHAPHQKVLLITHAGIIRCIWGNLLSIPLSELFKLPIGFGETLKIKIASDTRYSKIIQKG